MAGASSIFNQLIEREKDGLMIRTKNRPLPSNRISNLSAVILGIIFSSKKFGKIFFCNKRA